ncbi:MAG: flagellar modification protein B [Bacteriovoracaceae bacterium]
MANVLVTICARGGSKGVFQKNIRQLNGQPLIYYTIKKALEWGKAKRIIVSTDSEQIKAAALEAGAEVPFMRPAELSDDYSAKQPAIRHALIESERIFNEHYDYVLDLDPTAPIRTVEDIENSIRMFEEKDTDFLFSVVHAHKNPYFNMVEVNSEGKVEISKKLPGKIVRRQDAPKVYSFNASIYVYSRRYLADEFYKTKVIPDNASFYVMDDLSGIDIDREIDFKYIEFLISNKIVTL